MPVALLALLPQILQGIQIAINAAPTVISLVTNAKAWFNALFEAGLITAEQQNAVHAYVDAVVGMAKAGIPPPHWQVEPDPVPVVASPTPAK